MTPKQYYQQLLKEKNFHPDPNQLVALETLEALYFTLKQKRFDKRKWQTWLRAKKIPGAYIWGGVGIGKTLLLDTFQAALPKGKSLRLHFHPFMQFIHGKLKFYQGKSNPLQLIAKELAEQYDVLCFDEFMVHDITDAMLLGNLLQALFEQGIVLVSTSNVKPDDLYLKGLQRRVFLPTIALLKQNMTEIHMLSAIDYRKKELAVTARWYAATDPASRSTLERLFLQINPEIVYDTTIEINDRKIPVYALGQRAIWFSFTAICSVPRSQHDYLEIAKSFPLLFITDIPQFKANDSTTCRYLINLIDVLYDQKIEIVLSSAVSIAELNPHQLFGFEFARTVSRLQEMINTNLEPI